MNELYSLDFNEQTVHVLVHILMISICLMTFDSYAESD